MALRFYLHRSFFRKKSVSKDDGEVILGILIISSKSGASLREEKISVQEIVTFFPHLACESSYLLLPIRSSIYAKLGKFEKPRKGETNGVRSKFIHTLLFLGNSNQWTPWKTCTSVRSSSPSFHALPALTNRGDTPSDSTYPFVCQRIGYKGSVKKKCFLI